MEHRKTKEKGFGLSCRAADRQATGQKHSLILTLSSCQKEREAGGHRMETEITVN